MYWSFSDSGTALGAMETVVQRAALSAYWASPLEIFQGYEMWKKLLYSASTLGSEIFALSFWTKSQLLYFLKYNIARDVQSILVLLRADSPIIEAS